MNPKPLHSSRWSGVAAITRRGRPHGRHWAALALAIAVLSTGSAHAQNEDADKLLAMRLSEILQAARGVISANQSRIDDPNVGDKGLTGAVVLQETLTEYRKKQPDPLSEAADTRPGRLLRAELDAIVEVMDQNQATINAKGTGFKGFIPAVFARLVSEAFSRRAAGEASMKVTAPPDLVRNRRARPDAWEAGVIPGQVSKRRHGRRVFRTSRRRNPPMASRSGCCSRSITGNLACPATARRRAPRTSRAIHERAPRRTTLAASSAFA